MAMGVGQKWREWVPLTPVLEQLPQHFQQGVDTANLQITCIASLPKHLVLGTNVGLVYLAHLPTPSLMRLKCENPLSPITAVDTVSTVDEMIAAGSLDGTITIFQLPRVPNIKGTIDSNTPDYRGITLPQPVIKRFTVGSIHRARITSLTWSINGMRIFCGDAQGVVSQIDINYQTSECTAKELLREEYLIVQLSYSHKLLAISTLERTLIYSLTDNVIKQVGKKSRKHLGVFGCLWVPSSSHATSVLYASRPGLRIWSANTEGEVQQTHIIKDLPEDSRMQLLEPCYEKPRKGENFSFGVLSTVDSYVVAYNPHWLFIIDIQNLKVCNYCAQFGRIIDVAVSEREIFVLDGTRHVTCLSVVPPDIGEKKPTALGPGAFLEAENLKELKSRILSQGSDIFDQIARLGSSVAAKVTEHAKPPIVPGKDVKGRLYEGMSVNPNWDKHSNDLDPNKPTNYLNPDNPTNDPSDLPKSSTPTNISEGRDHGHQRSSSSGVISAPQQEKERTAPSLVPPRMVQSVSSFFPSLLTTPSLVKTFGKNPLLNDVMMPDKPGTLANFEEVVTSYQIVAQEGTEGEPLVLRDKSKRKLKKKHERTEKSSPEGENKSKLSDPCTYGSNLSISCSPSCVTPLSYTSTDKSSPESDNLLEEVSRQLSSDADTGSKQTKVEVIDNTSDSGRVENDGFEGTFHLEELDGLKVDTRPYEDFKSDIEKKESLLAEILDLGCLKMDHIRKMSEEKGGDNDLKVTFNREQSIESNSCSTPSTLKEQSPLPDSATNDFWDQQFRNNASFNSAEAGDDLSGDKKESVNDTSCSWSLGSNDGGERLGSNFSEDRLSCLSYGPPSGSSLVSLPGNRVPYVETHDPCVNEPSATFIVTDSSEIADVSWSYSTEQVQSSLMQVPDSHQYDQEEMSGGWRKYKLPSDVMSFSVSEKMVAFLDSHGCLFCRRTSLESPWKKYKLTTKASAITQSPSGSVLWVLYGINAYAVQAPTLEALSSAKMTLIARNVSRVSVDDNLAWYISDASQVCVIQSIEGKGLTIVSCEDFRLVRIVCYSEVVWGLTDEGKVVFRIGISAQSPTGHDWGVMEGLSVPVKDLALGPGRCGWILDTEGDVYFRPGVCADFPQGQDLKWWQVPTSDYMMDHVAEEPGTAILKISHEGTWLTETQSNCVFFHNHEFKGHVWNIFSSDSWSTICAEGVYINHGAISCRSPKGQLFIINPITKSSVPLEVVNNKCIVNISQRPEAMWVLTAAGDVYIRLGLSAKSFLGTRWEQLDLHQINDVHLCHLSCGTEVVWGVDTRGGVYMRQGPLTPPPTESLPPAWIQVDATSLKGNAVFSKVYVGMKTHMVWAIDSSHRVYVREAIFPEIPIGISWVLVPGILALQLSISENQVYALTVGGDIFVRTGVTEINYIGDTWEKIPGNLASISVTADNNLWGLNSSGQICQHETLLSIDTPADKLERTCDLLLSDESEDWEML